MCYSRCSGQPKGRQWEGIRQVSLALIGQAAPHPPPPFWHPGTQDRWVQQQGVSLGQRASVPVYASLRSDSCEKDARCHSKYPTSYFLLEKIQTHRVTQNELRVSVHQSRLFARLQLPHAKVVEADCTFLEMRCADNIRYRWLCIHKDLLHNL